MVIVVTGAASGLGKHLQQAFGGIGLSRAETAALDELRLPQADAIIHCAFNPARAVEAGSLYDYVNDNVLLTERLASLPHRKFVFLSSVDVYPESGGPHTEEEAVAPERARGLYALTKLMSEAIVRKRCANHLILRPTALLGKHARKNSLRRIVEDEDCELSLSGESEFNCLLHSDIEAFVRICMERDVTGTYNLASSENIRLSEVAEMLNRAVRFGSYTYRTGLIDDAKAQALLPALARSSRQVVMDYVREIG